MTSEQLAEGRRRYEARQGSREGLQKWNVWLAVNGSALLTAAEKVPELEARIRELEPMTHMTTLDAYEQQRARADKAEAERDRYRESLKEFIKVHAGAEVARRVLLGGIEGPDRFEDPAVVVYLQDLLDALDGGSKKTGLRALGDSPDERRDKGRAALRDH